MCVRGVRWMERGWEGDCADRCVGALALGVL